MTLPPDSLPEEPIRLPPARRRRARRSLVSTSADERTELLSRLAQRAYPSFEFFLFSLLCGAVLGAGFILDAPSLLLVGALLAPLMTPWVGMTLATVTGSGRFFFQTLLGLLTGGLLIFASSTLAGLAARIWLPLPLTQVAWYSRLWWPNLFVLTLGAVLLAVSFVRSEEKPILPSTMVAYELYLPLSAAGFGLGSGVLNLWPDGLLVFLVHLAWATFFGIITFAILRFRPSSIGGYVLAVVNSLVFVAILVVLSGLGALLLDRARFSPSSQTPIPLPTVTLEATRLPSVATSLARPTSSPTRIIQTPTPTVTATPAPTPVYAIINSDIGGGAIVRPEPGSEDVLTSVINGYMVEVLGVTDLDGVIWVNIRMGNGLEGWVHQEVLVTATPAPTW